MPIWNATARAWTAASMTVRAAALLAGLLLVPTAAAFWGTQGPRSVRLNLGPGDGPYLAGFFPQYEIDEGVALQWSRPEARVSLPLAFIGEASLKLRFGPPPKGPSRVGVALGGRSLGAFDCCRHRALQKRELLASTRALTTVTVALSVGGPEIVERGLFLDWIELDLLSGARLWLTGTARFRPAALVGLVFLLLWAAGFRAPAAAAVTVPLALGLALALLRDPWLVHLLLTLLPETLLFVALPLTVLGRVLTERGRLDVATLRTAVGLATLAFLARATALNHPDFFYPDLRTHALLVDAVGEAGWDFLRAPVRYLYTPRAGSSSTDTLVRATSGLWLRRIGGVDVGLPYSLALHSLLAPLGLSGDAKVAALKLLGALFSAVPVAVLAFLAARLGAPPLCALLLVAAPTALAELSLAAVPAVFGHALDALLMLWLVLRARLVAARRLALEGALVLAVVQLGYVSSVLSASLLMALLAVASLREGEDGRPLPLALALGLGSLVALAAYYRHFVPGALAALRLSFAGRTVDAAGDHLDLAGSRVVDAFVLWGFPILAVAAAAGYVLLLRSMGWERDVLVAWGLTVFVLGVLQRALPGVFGFVHVALFATPLVCLAAGAGLGALRARGGLARALAWAGAALVCAHGFWLQLQSVLGQLDNAR